MPSFSCPARLEARRQIAEREHRVHTVPPSAKLNDETALASPTRRRLACLELTTKQAMTRRGTLSCGRPASSGATVATLREMEKARAARHVDALSRMIARAEAFRNAHARTGTRQADYAIA